MQTFRINSQSSLNYFWCLAGIETVPGAINILTWVGQIQVPGDDFWKKLLGKILQYSQEITCNGVLLWVKLQAQQYKNSTPLPVFSYDFCWIFQKQLSCEETLPDKYGLRKIANFSPFGNWRKSIQVLTLLLKYSRICSLTRKKGNSKPFK